MKNFIFVTILFMTISGCTTTVPPSGFLSDTSRLKEGEFFKQEHVVPQAGFGNYTAIKIEPLELAYLEKASTHDAGDLADLAGAFRRHFEKALTDEGFRVLDPSSPARAGTLVVKPALVTLGTPQRTLNVISSILIWTPVTAGSAGFAAKLSDGGTRQIVAEIAEKNTGGSGSAKSITVGSYTRYTHAEAAFEVWGEHLAGMLKAKGMKPSRPV